jgi:uncharacterized protein YggU (UPF0235/DUF167 family)
MPLRLTIVAKPGKQVPSLRVRDGIIVAVRERPVDGRANEAIERAIAAWLGLSVRAVSIVGGASGRRKYVDVTGIDSALVAQRIAALEQG